MAKKNGIQIVDCEHLLAHVFQAKVELFNIT
jgi:hypothetical protein